jgi:hypothetical protein
MSDAQAHAVGAVNLLYATYELITGGVPGLPGLGDHGALWRRGEVADALREAVQTLRALVHAMVEPVLVGLAEQLATSVAAIHAEDYSGGAPSGSSSSSSSTCVVGPRGATWP